MDSPTPRHPDPARPPEAALPRAVHARVHARMLLALREGWLPLPAEDAWGHLDAMAARFAAGPARARRLLVRDARLAGHHRAFRDLGHGFLAGT